jgi:hypothetical protein
MQKRFLGLAVTAALVMLILNITGCKTISTKGVVLPPPQIAGAEFVGNVP